MSGFFFAGRAVFAFIVYGDGGFVGDYAMNCLSVSDDLPPEEKGWEITIITSGGQDGDTTDSGADWNAFLQSEVEKACELSLEQRSASVFVEEIMELLNNRITDNLAKQVVAAAGGGGDAALEEAQAIVSHGQGVTEDELVDWKHSLLRVKGMREREISVRDVDQLSTFELLAASRRGQGMPKLDAPGERVSFSIRGYTVARGLDGWPWEYTAIPENVFVADADEDGGDEDAYAGGSFVDLGMGRDAEFGDSDGLERKEGEEESGDGRDTESQGQREDGRHNDGGDDEDDDGDDDGRGDGRVGDRDGYKEETDLGSPAEILESNDESGTEAVAESMISLW